MDLSHHFSNVTNRRGSSLLKDIYTLFKVPGMRNIAGGLFLPFFQSGGPVGTNSIARVSEFSIVSL